MLHQSILLCMAMINLDMPNAHKACKYTDYIILASKTHNIKPEILASLIHFESRWKKRAKSSKGACGLTQVIPKYTKPRVKCKHLKKPIISIFVGAKTLKYWVYSYGKGKYSIGLCGYNAGFRCKGANKIRSGHKYSRRVLRLARKIRKEMKSILDDQT